MKRMRDDVACSHDMVWNSLCAICGSFVGAAVSAEKSDSVASLIHEDEMDEDFLSISKPNEYVKAAFLTHDPMLEVKKSYAAEMETEAIRALVKEKRGILILDLDHTLFQVTLRQINREYPSVEVWKFETELEHSGALLEGKTFWFNLPSAPTGAPFFLHLRPGLYSFLEAASRLFELYAYTQGTSEYAKKILSGIDPRGVYFGTPYRLIAREVDPMTGLPTKKNLSRVFPSEEGLVLIIDDRDDVWDSEASSQNLIKLTPYMYFQDEDRNKLFSMGPTNDVLLIPVVRTDIAECPRELTDFQLPKLERVLEDLHSEVYFKHGNDFTERLKFSFSEALLARKKYLFSSHAFFRNDKIGANLFRLIKQYGGLVLDKRDGTISLAEKVVINLGAPGQSQKGNEPELIHPWFVLAAVATLEVPSDPSWFALRRVEEEGLRSVWDCFVCELEGDGDLESDLMNDLLAG